MILEKNPHLDGEPEEFIEKNLKLVTFCLKKMLRRIHSHPSMEFDDAFSVGSIGLLKAYRTFDPTLYPVKFSTYAVPTILGEVSRALRDTNSLIKFPRSVKDNAAKILMEDMVEESVECIQEKLGMSRKEVVEAFDLLSSHQILSINQPVKQTRYDSPVLIEDTMGYEVEYNENITVAEILGCLKEKEKQVVLLIVEGYEQKVIANKVGVSQAQISRLLKSASVKIKELLGLKESRLSKTFYTEEIKEKVKELSKTTSMTAKEIFVVIGGEMPIASIYQIMNTYRPDHLRERGRFKKKE